MSRPWRIEYEGALYHLLSRGNERSDIFIEQNEYISCLFGLSYSGGQSRREIYKTQIGKESKTTDKV